MKFCKILLITFITLISAVKADLNKNLEQGGKLIFIRHAYAPGNGDPQNFNLNDCSTQRNLSNKGRIQAKKIRNIFLENIRYINKIYSSEWCRCKETASIAFKKYETKKFLNSFYSVQFKENKKNQIEDFRIFINKWDKKENLIFVTHYVFIYEILSYAPTSGEVIITDKNLKILDTLEIEY